MSSTGTNTNSGPGYAKHPGHRIELERVPHRIRVTAGGVTVADSADALLLRETGYDPVYYFPRDDVAMQLMERTGHATYCPFKGKASYWTLRAGGQNVENAAWSYEAPYDEVEPIRDRLAFYPERMDAWYRYGEEIGGN